MRRWAIFLLLPLAMALSVDFTTYPLYPSPGDSVRVVAVLTGSAENVELKVEHPLFETGWMEVGDVSGTASYVFHIALPESLRPGYYTIPLRLKYDENGKHYETPALLNLRVVPVEREVKMEIVGVPRQGRRTAFLLRIENRSDPIRNAVLYISPSLEGPVHLGTLEKNAELSFTAVPVCEGGLQEFNVLLKGYREAPFTYEYHVVLLCVPYQPVSVEANMGESVPDRPFRVRVKVRNERDVPELVHIVLRSNGELSGEKESTFVLDGRGERWLDLVVRPGEEDVLWIRADVFMAEGNFSYVFSAHVEREPLVIAYLKEIKGDRAVIEVANIGEGEAKHVLVETGKRAHFLGSLTAGDYDTVDIPLESNRISIEVSYSFEGQRIERTFEFDVERPKATFPWPLVLLFVLVVAYVGARLIRARGA